MSTLGAVAEEAVNCLNDTLCEETKGYSNYLSTPIQETAKFLNRQLGIPHVASAGVAAGAFFGLKWYVMQRKNPELSLWDSLLKTVEAEFGDVATPIKAALQSIYKLIEPKIIESVLTEQPILKQKGEVFEKLIKANVEDKLKEVIPSLVAVMFTPENKQTLQEAAVMPEIVTPEDANVESEQDANTAPAELAQAVEQQFKDKLQNLLLQMLVKSKDASAKTPEQIAATHKVKSKDGRFMLEEKGKYWMNHRDAYRLPRSFASIQVMVEVDENGEPVNSTPRP